MTSPTPLLPILCFLLLLDQVLAVPKPQVIDWVVVGCGVGVVGMGLGLGLGLGRGG